MKKEKKDKLYRLAVHTRIDHKTNEELERIAALNYVTKSSVIRWAIMLYLQGGAEKKKKNEKVIKLMFAFNRNNAFGRMQSEI